MWETADFADFGRFGACYRTQDCQNDYFCRSAPFPRRREGNARAWALHRSPLQGSLPCPSLAFLSFSGELSQRPHRRYRRCRRYRNAPAGRRARQWDALQRARGVSWLCGGLASRPEGAFCSLFSVLCSLGAAGPPHPHFTARAAWARRRPASRHLSRVSASGAKRQVMAGVRSSQPKALR